MLWVRRLVRLFFPVPGVVVLRLLLFGGVPLLVPLWLPALAVGAFGFLFGRSPGRLLFAGSVPGGMLFFSVGFGAGVVVCRLPFVAGFLVVRLFGLFPFRLCGRACLPVLLPPFRLPLMPGALLGCPVSSPVVVVCGSRRFPPPGRLLAVRVVRSLLRSGRRLAVGCSGGADAVALGAALSSGCSAASGSVSVFAVGGSCGSGFWSGSAASLVFRAARSGASVRWWAGGPASVPLRSRLVGRSLAAVSAASGTGSGSGLVSFVSALPPRPWAGSGLWRSCGSGSWSSVAAAALLGLPVVVFPVGFSLSSLPALPSGSGRWVPAGSGGVWSSGCLWLPD